ncbi:MAG: cupin domain-containing protein [Candidatus Binataceae bacterium]
MSTNVEKLNADLTQRVVIDTLTLQWIASPHSGVWRRMLERAAAEAGRTTSIVRYDAGAQFSRHAHPMGEEIFVLDGTFADEHGEYPAGTFILNPPGSVHTPHSPTGCTLFAKLCQYGGAGRIRAVIETRRMPWERCGVEGIAMRILYSDVDHPEYITMLKWAAGTRDRYHQHPAGEELFILAGCLADEHGVYPQGTWIRNPCGSAHAPYSSDGCIMLLKSGGF